jgi:hypothetical protein
MKKKKLKKELARLRGLLPVFTNGLLGMDFEVDHGDVKLNEAGRLVKNIGFPAPFTLKLTFENRKEVYTGIAQTMETNPED